MGGLFGGLNLSPVSVYPAVFYLGQDVVKCFYFIFLVNVLVVTIIV